MVVSYLIPSTHLALELSQFHLFAQLQHGGISQENPLVDISSATKTRHGVHIRARTDSETEETKAISPEQGWRVQASTSPRVEPRGAGLKEIFQVDTYRANPYGTFRSCLRVRHTISCRIEKDHSGDHQTVRSIAKDMVYTVFSQCMTQKTERWRALH